MKAIVLAAGKGKRLASEAADTPQSYARGGRQAAALLCPARA